MQNLIKASVANQFRAKSRRSLARSQSLRVKLILAPIDFSRPSLKALPYALAVSRQFGAKVHLLHVTDLSKQPPPTLMTLPLVPQAELDRRLMKRLQSVALKHRTDGNVLALEPRTGTAYEEICATARELKAEGASVGGTIEVTVVPAKRASRRRTSCSRTRSGRRSNHVRSAT